MIIFALPSRTTTWFHFWNNIRRFRAVNSDDTTTRHGSHTFPSDTAECVKRLLKLIGQMETEPDIIILWYYYYHYGGDAFNAISHDGVRFPAESERRAEEAVTTETSNIKELEGIIFFWVPFIKGAVFMIHQV